MSTKILKIFKFSRPTSLSPQRFLSRYVEFYDTQPNKYGGKTNVTVLPGVGVGPEIMDSTLKILKAAKAPLSFEILTLPDDLVPGQEDPEFENALISIRRNRLALKGNIELQTKSPYIQSRNILLRKTLDLYVYVVWCKTFPGIPNHFENIDTIVIRQNTEGEYLMLEHEPRAGSIESLKVITRQASEMVADFAFKFAVKNNRKQILIAHNANVQKYTEGLFVDAALSVSRKYPSINVAAKDVALVSSAIIKNPAEYDMILATNLNGSMISNLLIGMLGGPGLTPGTNLGRGGIAVFEPGARNKGVSIVGKDIANPVAMIFAAINLLNFLGDHNTANLITKAVHNTVLLDRVLTQDLGGDATTTKMTNAVIRHIERELDSKAPPTVPQVSQKWKTYCDIPDKNLPEPGFPEKN